MNKLDSLDIVDAEYMVHNQQQQSSMAQSDYLMAQRVEGDPWFAKMNNENKFFNISCGKF